MIALRKDQYILGYIFIKYGIHQDIWTLDKDLVISNNYQR